MDGDRIAAEAGDAAEAETRPGIQSVETAALILAALAKLGAPAKLRDVATASGMAPGKVHRYLVSLVRSGLAAQIAETGRYGVGPLAISAGLAGLAQVDAVRLAGETLAELRDAVGETAVFAVWSERGPTTVRFEESVRPVTMNVRVGSALPLTRSALGLAFLAHLPSATAAPVLLDETGSGSLEDADTVKRVEAVRRHGVAAIKGLLLPGASALAAPVFDHTGAMAGAVGVVGTEAGLDVSVTGAAAQAVKRQAAGLSERLGYRD
jgi:DNA-binding IclR family transcriptional regulator